MASSISPSRRLDPFTSQTSSAFVKLTAEIQIMILSNLEAGEIASMALTCRAIRLITQDNYLWRLLLTSRFPNLLPEGDQEESYLEAYQQRSPSWRLINGVCAEHSLREGEEYASGASLIGIGSSQFAAGTFYSTITIWDAETRACLYTLEGHTKMVICLAIYEDMLISGSLDTTIKIWDLKTQECIHTLEGHSHIISALTLIDDQLVSGSDDCTIKIWDLKTQKCIYTFANNQDAITSIACHERKIISGHADSTIKIWDLDTKKCLSTLFGHEAAIFSLIIHKGQLISGSNGIKIWDLESGECLQTFSENWFKVLSLTILGGKLISICSDEGTRVWDLKTGKYLHRYNMTHGKCFTFLNNQLILGNDYGINICDFDATENIILKTIINRLRGKSSWDLVTGMDRFCKLPKTTRHKIYSKLYGIIKQLAPGCAEDAFHNRNRQRSTSSQRAQAIEEYLNTLSSEQPS